MKIIQTLLTFHSEEKEIQNLIIIIIKKMKKMKLKKKKKKFVKEFY